MDNVTSFLKGGTDITLLEYLQYTNVWEYMVAFYKISAINIDILVLFIIQ